MGDRGASSIHHPPWYVPACHQARAEGGGEVHLVRLLAEPAKAGPRGRCTRHTTCRVPDLPQRHQRPLPQCIFAKKVAQLTTLQAPVEGGGYPGHPVLPEEPLAQARQYCHARGPTRGCGGYLLPVHQWESQPRSRRREDLHNEALQEAREAHQQALKAAHMPEHNIKRLSQGVEGAQYPCPCSCSSSCLQRKSLDRCERCPSWHRLERWVTFWDPEVEPDSSERPYGGPQGHSFRTHLEGSDGVPPPIKRQEMVCPQEIPTAYPDVILGRGYLPEPSIRNYEVWVDYGPTI